MVRCDSRTKNLIQYAQSSCLSLLPSCWGAKYFKDKEIERDRLEIEIEIEIKIEMEMEIEMIQIEMRYR